jgi:hypothetical protein
MNKISKEKRDKIILVGIGTLAAVAGIWFAIISTQLASHAEAKKRLTDAEQKLSRGRVALKSADATAQQLKDFAAALSKCEKAMAVPNDMYSWFFQTMNAFRAGYQVDIPQFSRETPAEVGLFPTFPYRAAVFTVRGTAFYHDFGRFLADFENAYPYIRVQGVELEPNFDSANAGTAVAEKLTFKMDLLTLVRPTAP